MAEATPYHVREERATDAAAIRAVHVAAFDTPAEADLVDALRDDGDAYLPGLSWVAEGPGGRIAAHVLLTRCRVDGSDALALAPVAVLPEVQRRGLGAAVIRAGLDVARERGESWVIVLGHPDYYPRFGFQRASRWGIRAPFDVPDDALMAMPLRPDPPAIGGVIAYAAAFG